MEIPFFDYPNIFKRDQKDFEKIFRDVCLRGAYILQKDLHDFEKNLGKYIKAKHVIGVSDRVPTDPAHYELLVRIPVDALIPFNKDTPIHFYPNARPLISVTGTIHVFGFQATPDPDGLLSYKLRAKIDEKDKDDLRIGWKGTAKIYGGWTILSYAILRRPLASLRQMVGA